QADPYDSNRHADLHARSRNRLDASSDWRRSARLLAWALCGDISTRQLPGLARAACLPQSPHLSAADRSAATSGACGNRFRRMNRREDQIVFSEERNAGLVAGGIRRVEREFGQPFTARVTRSDLAKLYEIILPDGSILVDPF